MEFERLVKVYVLMRDEKTAIKKKADEACAELKAKMDKLEVAMLRTMGSSKSIATDYGTAYTTNKTRATASDWEQFYTFLVDNNQPEMLQKRLSIREIEAYAEVHDGALPPGVTIHTEKVVRVRRSN